MTAYFHPNCCSEARTVALALKLVLVDGEPVGIPTVPAEGRSGGERLRRGELRNEAHGRESSNWKNP